MTKLVIALLVAIVVLAILGVFLLAHSQPSPAQNIQESSAPQQQSSPTNPNTQGETQYQQSYMRRFFIFVHTYDKEIVALSTIAIAAFTVVLAFATAFLFFATRNLVQETEAHGQRSLRAYVSLQSGSVTNGTVDGVPGYLFIVQLKNSGLTPGYSFTTWLKPPAILPVDALPFTDATPIQERTGSSIIAPTGGDAWMNWNGKFGEGDVEAIRNGTKAFFIWGGADYRDIFNRNRHFIFRLRVSGPENAANGGNWALKPHPLGYDAN